MSEFGRWAQEGWGWTDSVGCNSTGLIRAQHTVQPTLMALSIHPCRLYRMPSLACAAASAHRASSRQGQRTPASLFVCQACTPGPAKLDTRGNVACFLDVPNNLLNCPAQCSVDLSSTFYALNPSGDLADTQSAFQDWFSGMRGWQVGAGWGRRRMAGCGWPAWQAGALYLCCVAAGHPPCKHRCSRLAVPPNLPDTAGQGRERPLGG